MVKKTYYLIGDCHSNQILNRAIEDLDFDIYNNNFKVFAHAGWPMRAFGTIEMEKNFTSDINGSFRGEFWKVDNWKSIDPIKFLEIQDSENSVMIFFLGYIDIKNILPLKDDSYQSIERFMLEIKRFFPKSLIQIIEPMPQFTISLYRDDEKWIEYSYEQRRKQNDLFIENLREIAKINGVEIILSQSQILESFNTDIDNIGEESSLFFDNKPTDNFSANIYKGIWDKLKTILNLS